MKKLLIALAIAALTLQVKALPTLLISTNLSGTAFTTTNSSSFIFSGTPVYWSHAGVTATNAAIISRQVSVDGVNWTTVFVYFPAITNSAQYLIPAVQTNITVYTRDQIVTTNTVSYNIITSN